MRNHESMGQGEDFDDEYENTDSYVDNGEDLEKTDVSRYEKYKDRLTGADVELSDEQKEEVIFDLAYRLPGDSPRERYDKEPRRKEIDYYRLLNEIEVLTNCHAWGEDIPDSKFLKYLLVTYPNKTKTTPLSDSEKEHFREVSDNFIKCLPHDNNNNRDLTFVNYLQSLVRICENTYGKGSRAVMYLCDDLDEMLRPGYHSAEENRTKIIDRLIGRKIEAAGKIAMGKAPAPDYSYLTAGFTALLDLPDGIENRSVKELIDEGVPSLYGYES